MVKVTLELGQCRLGVRATLHPDAPTALELSIARIRVLDYL